MQVFNLFFKLLKSNKGIIIMYFAIFLTVALVISESQSVDGNNDQEKMKEEILKITIIDEDKETFGEGLTKYFSEGNKIIEMEYDEDAILDKLYWRKLDYALVIPKGFEKSLLDEDIDDMELKCMKVPGYFDASFFESELSTYTAKLKSLLQAGYSLEEAQQQLIDLQGEEIKVEVANFINENQNDKTTMFMLYVPYLFITLGMNGIGLILLTFNSPLVKARMECSSTTMKERMTGLICGIVLYGVLLMVAVMVVVIIRSQGSILTDVRLPYFLLNMFAMLLFSLSLGFFTGTIAKNQDVVSGLVNVLSLGLCFLGGVFVPYEFFGEGVLKVAKFVPTYWYAVTNMSIGAMTEMTPEFAKEIFWQTGLIAGYALVIFAVTIVIVANKRKKIA
ncbi:MAG: ABC transporter permease [Lachnospiraceae bacterium]|nr:ABC transporter permease [Lachnospiraceae bacterium]